MKYVLIMSDLLLMRTPKQGVQRTCTCRMVLVVNFFVFLKLLSFYFAVAIYDLVHNVKAMIHLL